MNGTSEVAVAAAVNLEERRSALPLPLLIPGIVSPRWFVRLNVQFTPAQQSLPMPAPCWEYRWSSRGKLPRRETAALSLLGRTSSAPGFDGDGGASLEGRDGWMKGKDGCGDRNPHSTPKVKDTRGYMTCQRFSQSSKRQNEAEAIAGFPHQLHIFTG